MGKTAMPDLSQVLERLRENRDALPWAQRRKVVERLRGPVADGRPGEPFRSLLLLLLEDPKWEVRCDAVELLGTVVDAELAMAAQRMLSDSHTYVRRAAKRAVEQRKRQARQAAEKKRGIELVRALYEDLEAEHGKPAAEQARRLAETMYDTLIGSTMHGMRTVLTSLSADTHAIVQRQDRGELEPMFLQQKMDKITGRLHFMQRLLDDMCKYAHTVPKERSRIAVADLLDEAVNMVREHLRAGGASTSNVALSVSVETGLACKVCRSFVIAALVDIITNAFEALPTDGGAMRGQVKIDATAVDKQVRLIVRDTGIGITAQDLAELRQCVPGRTTKATGTGFGLCSARRYIEAHGGTVQIDSKEGKGTKVTLMLPMAGKG